MKRSEMVQTLTDFLENSDIDVVYEEVEIILRFLEAQGMKPPRLPEDTCQAILNVYYAGYSLNQWEEDIEKDAAVMEMKARREKAKTDRIERIRLKHIDKIDAKDS